jgi:hypothetical protein
MKRTTLAAAGVVFVCLIFVFQIGVYRGTAKGAFCKPLRFAQGKFAFGKYCEAPLDSPKTLKKKYSYLSIFLKVFGILKPFF